MLGKDTFSHKWVLLKKSVSECVLHISISLWSQGGKRKSPVIPVALITTIHKNSYHIKALSGLTWDFMQITVTVSAHIYTMMNAGFITEQ
jgi:hypothetical protein